MEYDTASKIQILEKDYLNLSTFSRGRSRTPAREWPSGIAVISILVQTL